MGDLTDNANNVRKYTQYEWDTRETAFRFVKEELIEDCKNLMDRASRLERELNDFRDETKRLRDEVRRMNTLRIERDRSVWALRDAIVAHLREVGYVPEADVRPAAMLVQEFVRDTRTAHEFNPFPADGDALCRDCGRPRMFELHREPDAECVREEKVGDIILPVCKRCNRPKLGEGRMIPFAFYDGYVKTGKVCVGRCAAPARGL